MTIRVVIGEDSAVVREGIQRMLERTDDIEVVSTSADVATLRAAIAEGRPDVVLTDIRMPPTLTDEGIRIAVELRASAPEVGVVVLSQHVEPTYALALFEGGSARRAYLLKERLRDSTELTRAIREVASGGSVVDPLVVDELVRARTARENSPLRELTESETVILGMIAQGLSNAAIADELVVTKRAVERHINAIFLKLDLRDAEDVSRRVKAALVYLADQQPSS
jgi:DNA-binding NarL/FixJ family response regulator